VRDKLAKLVNVRRHKMEEGLHQIGSTATVRVNGLGAYELNLIRANFQGALNMFLKLETVRGRCCTLHLQLQYVGACTQLQHTFSPSI
jgi:hypothetical protein